MDEKKNGNAALTYYVAPNGNDHWSGLLPEPCGNDGPWATVGRANDFVRERGISGFAAEDLTVCIRQGFYSLPCPLRFEPGLRGKVAFRAWPGERPVLSGGRRLTGWKIEEVNGLRMWTLQLPEVSAGQWYFRQLFVNGQRRGRPRLPKSGYYWMQDVPGTSFDAELFSGSNCFVSAPGDVRPWRNLTDVEAVALHYWIEERMPIVSYDEETGLVVSSRKSIFALKDDFKPRYAKYYCDNVFEALDEPGLWYLDRRSGTLYYAPLPGEDPETAEVIAPALRELVLFSGNPEGQEYVENVHLEGLAFAHADWEQPRGGWDLIAADSKRLDPGTDYAAAPQGAANVPGAIRMRGARHCAVMGCAIRHVGGYGVDLADGCSANQIVGNEISDIGAGGVRLTGADASGLRHMRTGGNDVSHNHIHDGGIVYAGGVGVSLLFSHGNRIAHNHIHDLFYTGIHCGWIWGYGESGSWDNLILKNHIHDLGKGVLNDMGGVYLLGVQQGTVIRGNVIHDVKKANYGGWAVYLDEGSSHVVVEDNVCWGTDSHPFTQHYGRENIVRNNIFVLGGEGGVSHGRWEGHNQFTFERNIVLSQGTPVFDGGYGADFSHPCFKSDLNLFWDVTGREPFCACREQSYSLDEWKALGYDLHSVVRDPLFTDLKGGGFTLASDSPALALGFRPIDNSDAGPDETVCGRWNGV